ncbi:MAG: alanine/ornithine racemase family PLP-dependent enzyme [Thermoplasmatota archaeon]
MNGTYPRLLIDPGRIEENTRTIADIAADQNIEIAGVTKATCGDPEVASAMLRGGAATIAESRVKNLKRLRDNGIEAPLMLLRTPMLSEVDDVVELADVSLNSEIRVMEALSEASLRRDRVHGVIPMVEMGEIREGMNIEELLPAVVRILDLKGLELRGIGMNLACLSGVIPTAEKMIMFDSVVESIEEETGERLKVVSGGNSANIPGLLERVPQGRTDQLRIGEGILLGLETVNRTPIPGTHQDAFVLEAEVIERKRKPSVPDGKLTQNAFGEMPTFEDKGIQERAICAVGRQDVIVEDLRPVDIDHEIIGSSSDHIVLDVGSRGPGVGDIVKFTPRYGALVHLCTSPFVKKVYV